LDWHEGRCVPSDICVTAHSGRQIDRFLRRNKEFAESYLHDSFGERRAIAAQHAPLEALRALELDEDEVVRRIVAERVLPADAVKMLHDEDWVVQLHAAEHAPLESIAELVDDAEPDVRTAVRQ
jgi:hypothetical protein